MFIILCTINHHYVRVLQLGGGGGGGGGGGYKHIVVPLICSDKQRSEFPVTYLPIQPECCLQRDELLLLAYIQDVPQVDGSLNHHRLSGFCWRSLMKTVVRAEDNFWISSCQASKE